VSTENSIPAESCPTLSDTGRRLKLLRELAGISQRELAKRAGLTNSSISTIEQGQVSPSVQSLARILAAIPISFADFFAFNPDLPVSDLGKQSHPQLNTRIILLSTHDAGIFSTAAVDVSGVVLEGVLTLTLSNGPRTLSAGETFYLSGGQLFRLSNSSAHEVRLLLCSLFDRSF
jgi:transcriptional regulator with XRE-family HTH domain